jgi:hypothetical protein
LGIQDEAFECTTMEECRAAVDSVARVIRNGRLDSDVFEVNSFALEPEANKAEREFYDVMTEAGMKRYITPKSARHIDSLPDSTQWHEARRKAWAALETLPRSRWVRRLKGDVLMPLVETYKYKRDAATGGFDARSARKARMAGDGPRHRKLVEAAGLPVDNSPSSASTLDDCSIKMIGGATAVEDRRMRKADIPNAYTLGKRRRPPVRLQSPYKLQRFDEDGHELVLELGDPLWGEMAAGYEWAVTRDEILEEIGWERGEGTPSLWWIRTPEGVSNLGVVVDDLLFAIQDPHQQGFSASCVSSRTIAALESRLGVKIPYEDEPSSFAGYGIARDRSRRALTLHMRPKIVEMARAYLPELFDENGDERAGNPWKLLSLPSGTKLANLASGMRLVSVDEKLSPEQKDIPAKVGDLKWIERVTPHCTKLNHSLSCVAARAPPEAPTVAKATVLTAYQARSVGLTFGGGGIHSNARLSGTMFADFRLADGAPLQLESTADSTWDAPINVYGVLLTCFGASVVHRSKKIQSAESYGSSTGTEGSASQKCLEDVMSTQAISTALGCPIVGPTFMGTDNKANLLIATETGTASRSKHALRRYLVLQQAIRDGHVTMGHIPDEENPSDFLTKFINAKKFAASIEYCTNSRNAVSF